MSIDELHNIMETIEELQQKKNAVKAKEELLLEKISELGYKNITELDKAIDELEDKIQTKQAVFESNKNKFMEKYDALFA